MKHVVWIVKIMSPPEEFKKFATGFSVSGNGLIMTSCFRLVEASSISVRRFGSDRFIGAQLVENVPNDAGLALLKINQISDYVQMGVDAGLTLGMDVFSIGHQPDFCFTSLTGKLVSTLKPRTEVHIYTDGLRDHMDTLNPDLQLQQIHGFSSMFNLTWMMQTLGAPVFNSRGCVFGMIIAMSGGFDYMVPAARLKQFLDQYRPTLLGVASSGEMSSR